MLATALFSLHIRCTIIADKNKVLSSADRRCEGEDSAQNRNFWIGSNNKAAPDEKNFYALKPTEIRERF